MAALRSPLNMSARRQRAQRARFVIPHVARDVGLKPSTVVPDTNPSLSIVPV